MDEGSPKLSQRTVLISPKKMKTPDTPSKSSAKKILLISYHFPPSTAVGGLRIANFAKYLPLFGWNVYVLTIKDKYLEKLDAGRLNDLNVEKIYKTGKLPTVLQAYLKLKSLYYSVLKRSQITPKELESTFNRANNTPSGPKRLSGKLKRFIVSFLTLPDTERSWVLPAVFRAVREIKRENIGCILTSSPPYSVHLIGLLVKMITGVRWVADFRDPWISTGSKRLYVTSALSTRVETWLEQQVIQRADLVLTTTEKLCANFKESYASLPETRFVHITNGFDAEIAAQFKHLRKYDTFTLTYAGTLYLGRNPEPAFKAIHELAQEGKLSLQNIKVKLVGNCRYIDGCPTSQVIHAYGLDSVVEVLDTVPYFKALEIIKQSHVALLFAPGQPFQIPAKVFDYMGLGTRILALTEKGATWDLITSTGAGTAFYQTDIKGIKEFIYRSMYNSGLTESKNGSAIQHQFDRRSITHDLARHLDHIADLQGKDR